MRRYQVLLVHSLGQHKPAVDRRCRAYEKQASRVFGGCCFLSTSELNANIIEKKIGQNDSHVEDVFGDAWVDLEDRVSNQRLQGNHEGSLMLMGSVLHK